LVYVDRIIQGNPNFIVNSLNIHRLLITSVMLAAKFFDDQYFNNAYYAKVGGVPCTEMNSLEVEFLFMTNFTLFVSTETYKQYYEELRNHASSNSTCGCNRTKVPPLVFQFEEEERRRKLQLQEMLLLQKQSYDEEDEEQSKALSLPPISRTSSSGSQETDSATDTPTEFAIETDPDVEETPTEGDYTDIASTEIEDDRDEEVEETETDQKHQVRSSNSHSNKSHNKRFGHFPMPTSSGTSSGSISWGKLAQVKARSFVSTSTTSTTDSGVMTDSPVSHPLPHPPQQPFSANSRSSSSGQQLQKPTLTYRAVTYPQLPNKSKSVTTSKQGISRGRSDRTIPRDFSSSSRTQKSSRYRGGRHHEQYENEDSAMTITDESTIGVT